MHVTPRGGGSGTAGGALGEGIVIALPRNQFWGRISGFSVQDNIPRITVGAGVYHNELQEFLRNRGFFLPADVSSAKFSQIGGNISTKASGPHALKYGAIDRFLESIEFVTARGELVNTADDKTIPVWINREITKLANKIKSDAEAWNFLTSRQDMKTTSGYNLFAFIKEYGIGSLLTQLLAGSNGTLGFLTRATLRGEAFNSSRAVMLLYFDELAEVGRAVVAIRDVGAAAMEIMNKKTVQLVGARSGRRGDFPDNAHMLLVECTGGERFAQIEEISRLIETAGYRLARNPATAIAEEDIEKLWELRKQILPYIWGLKPPSKALAVVNDIGVDPLYLAGLIHDLEAVFKKHDIETLIYGHAGNGNLHLRPLFDLSKPDLKLRVQRLADDVYDAVLHYGGTISGEHGVGRLKAAYLQREWGASLYSYMKEVKSIFDPEGVLNPGVIFSDKSITDNMQDDLLHSAF